VAKHKPPMLYCYVYKQQGRQQEAHARAASSSSSKHPRLVGLPPRRNCASQRLVGNVWCTPRKRLVNVRPVTVCFAFGGLCALLCARAYQNELSSSALTTARAWVQPGRV
jgi:hypothetical protein